MARSVIPKISDGPFTSNALEIVSSNNLNTLTFYYGELDANARKETCRRCHGLPLFHAITRQQCTKYGQLASVSVALARSFLIVASRRVYA